MTLEQKHIERFYELLRKTEQTDQEVAADLRWAIFELERIFHA